MLTIYRNTIGSIQTTLSNINISLNTTGSIETTLSIVKIKVLDDHLLMKSPKQSDSI